eukprot:scaffold122269_cov63-Phaeocystis_antarctica.AAC.2
MLRHLWTAVAISHEKELDRLATHVGHGRAHPILVLEGQAVSRDRIARVVLGWEAAHGRLREVGNYAADRRVGRPGGYIIGTFGGIVPLTQLPFVSCRGVRHEAHPAATHALRLLLVVRDPHARSAAAEHELLDQECCLGVERTRGLVEQQHLRPCVAHTPSAKARGAYPRPGPPATRPNEHSRPN